MAMPCKLYAMAFHTNGMKSDLAKHIEILLLNNDCVIVPGFGGFMTHHVDSVYVDEEGIFLPPSRTLGFNPQLHVNDSLLAQSYVEYLDISYPEALRCIEDDVYSLKQILSNEGRYELPDIGELSVNQEGNYVFTPCASGVLTPELYALNSFDMAKLASKKSVGAVEDFAVTEEKKVATQPLTHPEPAKDTESAKEDMVSDTVQEEIHSARIISLSNDFIRNIAAVAITLIILVFANMPIGDSSKSTQQLCTIDTSLLQKMMPQMISVSDDGVKPVKVVNNNVITISHSEEEASSEEEETKSVNEKRFVIVLASGVSRKNAEAYINSIKKYGIDDARIINNVTINHIVCGAFESQAEATLKAREMRGSASLFADVWVMETTNL